MEISRLAQILERIDGRGYPAYKEIKGCYEADGFRLHIDHVQGDPFAAPSRLRAELDAEQAQIPPELRESSISRVAVADYLARAFARGCVEASSRDGSGKSGLITIDEPGQEVLLRTAVAVKASGALEARFWVGLPAAGRRVRGGAAKRILLQRLPQLVARSLVASVHPAAELRRHVQTVVDANDLREQVVKAGLVAFVADGALLPRRSGIDPRPMEAEQAIRFQAPPALARSFELPSGRRVRGMGIPPGVTLIVGGGYHGKSTLLAALELGVYNHCADDGRELVVTDPGAVKIRAEDGRRVERVDISSFIDSLPAVSGRPRSTEQFCSEDASGSTSQAANVVEAIEAGAKVLLVDEDTAATNFMIRDHRMQRLIAKEHEPITPFVDRVGQLHRELGVSTVLVMGGSGDYFDVADTVIAMQDFIPHDLTAEAKEIAQTHGTERQREGSAAISALRQRVPMAASLDASKGRHEVKVGARGLREIQFGRHSIELSLVAQLVAHSQLEAMAHALVFAKRELMDGHRTVSDVLELVERELAEKGLDALVVAGPARRGDLAEFRRFELASALNRLRSLRVR